MVLGPTGPSVKSPTDNVTQRTEGVDVPGRWTRLVTKDIFLHDLIKVIQLKYPNPYTRHQITRRVNKKEGGWEVKEKRKTRRKERRRQEDEDWDEWRESSRDKRERREEYESTSGRKVLGLRDTDKDDGTGNNEEVDECPWYRLAVKIYDREFKDFFY